MAKLKIEITDKGKVEETHEFEVEGTIATMSDGGPRGINSRVTQVSEEFLKPFLKKQLKYYEKLGFDKELDFHMNDITNYLLVADILNINPKSYQTVFKELLNALSYSGINLEDVLEKFIDECGDHRDRKKQELSDLLSSLPDDLKSMVHENLSILNVKINKEELINDLEGALNKMVDSAIDQLLKQDNPPPADMIDDIKSGMKDRFRGELEEERRRILKERMKGGGQDAKH